MDTAVHQTTHATRGTPRRDVEVRAWCGDVRAGALRHGHRETTLALAVDASRVGERVTVRTLCVRDRGGGSPVARVSLPATHKGRGRPPGRTDWHGWQGWRRRTGRGS
jgi:hypothetical protein